MSNGRRIDFGATVVRVLDEVPNVGTTNKEDFMSTVNYIVRMFVLNEDANNDFGWVML